MYAPLEGLEQRLPKSLRILHHLFIETARTASENELLFNMQILEDNPKTNEVNYCVSGIRIFLACDFLHILHIAHEAACVRARISFLPGAHEVSQNAKSISKREELFY